MAETIEKTLLQVSYLNECIRLQTLNENGEIPNSFTFSESLKVDHQSVVGVIKSLETDLLITTEQLSEQFWELSEEALSVIEQGSPGR